MNVVELMELCAALLEQLGVRSATPRGLAVALGLGTERTVVPGTRLFSEGDASTGVYVLLQGELRLLLRDAGGEPRHLLTILAPSVVGHLSAVDRSPHSSTCVGSGTDPAVVVHLDPALISATLPRADEVGAALRRLLGASILRRLSGEEGVSVLPGESIQAVDPAPSGDAPTPAEQDRQAVSDIIAGFDIDTSDLEALEVVESPSGKGSDG